jgi:hypothetical protein
MQALDEALGATLDPVDAEANKRAKWGLSPEAIAEAAKKDAMYASSSYE